MSSLRSQDLSPSPSPALRKQPDELPPEFLEQGGFERRLGVLLAAWRHDELALQALLARIPPAWRQAARIVAVRYLGAARAQALCSGAFADDGLLQPAVAEPAVDQPPERSPSSLLELARARGLAQVIDRLVDGRGEADASLAHEVFAGAEEHLALAALLQARR